MSTRQLTILIVEDTPDIMELMRLLLEREGHRVFSADTGVKGSDMVQKIHPDLILLDLALPEKDGWTLAAELKADTDTQDIPIIAVTAHALPQHRKRALDAGCDTFIVKPFSITTFNKEIERLFS